MRRIVIATACALACWPARAEPVALDDHTLKGALSGKTVYLDTPLGVGIPITFHGNGLMSGKAGLLEYILGAATDRGRWWVADGRLCQKWFKWLDAQPSCMRLSQDGNKIFWRRDDGLSGTATIASALPPGADAAPQGLGGPVHEPELPREPVGHEPRQSAAAVVAPSAPRQAKPAITATRPGTGPHASRQAPAQARAVETRSSERDPLPMLSVPFVRAGHGDAWCRGEEVAGPHPDSLPDLIKVARAAYAAGEQLTPMRACLGAEPALQYMARLGLDRP